MIASKLNYANVMATIAVFLALGGGAFAAVKLGKNSVKTKNIAGKAVTANKLANNAVTEAKIAGGAVTEAKIAGGAVTEAKVKKLTYTAVSGFTNGWSAAGGIPAPEYGKDALGIVHLRGNMASGTDNLPAFTLPTGVRPAKDISTATTSGFSTECTIGVEANGEVTSTGCNNLFVSLDTITFSAAP
ncbi:MAG: hypothetical protein FJW90_00810 [Actinobacteria bacterium]|nr:hypothetical protein [Actinomycetota bacterium]